MKKLKESLKSVRIKLFITLSFTVIIIIAFLIVLNNFVFETYYLHSKQRDLKDVYKSNVVSMEELKTQASKYFGYDVINYAETLPSNLQDTKWQLFYAGALDIDSATATTLGIAEEERTEERIYLISKEYVKNTVLPAKNGITPVAISGSNYKAAYETTGNRGIIPQYTGSIDVVATMKKYNSDYFKDYTSTNSNMKAVAYMLDTATWSTFANSSEGYAEWAIGGPTLELLFTAYNRYKGTAYEADAVSMKGYQVRKTSDDSFVNYLSAGAIVDDTSTVDNPYSVSSLTSQAEGYHLASPSNSANRDMLSGSSKGGVSNGHSNGESNGFRPIVLLNSNFQLEKKTSGGKEVFKIVLKTE